MKSESAASRPTLATPQPVSGSFLSGVRLRHCVEPWEIDQVRHLREGIDLSTHTSTPQGEQEFRWLEKKEMSAASPFRSTWTARRSVRSASCRLANS